MRRERAIAFIAHVRTGVPHPVSTHRASTLPTMDRDPLMREILARLNDEIDPKAFELCANALLVSEYATLAPVSGGSDCGFDGSVGTAEGPFPLICTTSTRVRENVIQSINRSRSRVSRPARAIVATSRPLTPHERRRIEDTALESGVRIVNIHAQDDFANRLYQDRHWRLELLGLTGDPPALSALPPRGRPALLDELIGRQVEFSRVRDHQGDLLIVGQPGAGKTDLHRRLALDGRCLFVVSGDETRIANELRAGQPECLVVDDAHAAPSLLDLLLRLRHDLGASFRIHANCWPNYEPQFRAHLGLAQSDVISLPPMTRQDILRVVNACGVAGPDVLLHLLLEQSSGKPGLAVALTEACKRGEVDRVWTGEALADHLLTGRRVGASEREKVVLAAFSLGGDAGMSLESVAGAVDISVVDVREIVTKLDAGGVIDERDANHLVVQPAALRALLVKQVFYDGAKSLRAEPLLAASRSPSETAHVLMGARQRGGSVGTGLIEQLVLSSQNSDAWEHFAHVDDECADRVLRHHRAHVASAAAGLLARYPSRTIPLLLDALIAEQGQRSNSLDGPRRSIEEWLVGDDAVHPGHVEHRRLLLDAVGGWNRSSSPRGMEVLGWVLGRSMSPSFSVTRMKPGTGREYASISGVYPLGQLQGVAGLWPRVLAQLASAPKSAWSPVLKAISSWCFPQQLVRNKALPKKTSEFMRAIGSKMLRETVGCCAADRAVRSWASHVADRARLDVAIEVDSDFELLFAERNFGGDWQQAHEQWLADVDRLAVRLTAQNQADAIDWLLGAEQEASALDIGRRGHDRRSLYARLAALASSPSSWLESLIAQEAPLEIIAAFLAVVVEHDRNEAIRVVRQLLCDGRYERLAINYGLSFDPPDRDTLDSVIAKLSPINRMDVYWLAHLNMPLEVRRRLLVDPRRDVRAHAVVAEWIRASDSPIPESIRTEWRDAVPATLTDDDHDFHLQQILASDADLAFPWLKERLRHDPRHIWRMKDLVVAAASQLDRARRGELLDLINGESFDLDCFDAILGADLTLFSDWLARSTDARLRERPLAREPDERWIALAEVALRHAIDADTLADLCWPRSWSLDSNYWQELSKKYEGLLSHPEPRLHVTARRGIERARQGLARAQSEERDEEIFGLTHARRRRRIR